MEQFVSLAQMLPLIEEQVNNGGTVVFSPNGSSMLPFIRQGVDKVELTAPPQRLKRYDIAFYRRDNGAFVLHRVRKFGKDGTYIIRGDHQFEYEYGVKHTAVIAVVKGVYRGDKYIARESLQNLMWAVFGSMYFRVRYRIRHLLKGRRNNADKGRN